MKRMLSTALGLALFASTSAFAYDGYVTASVYLRAGPDSGYPSVARLHAGTSVIIEGCVDDWSWCDVSNHDDRGWVSASYLQHEYQGHRVLVPQYGVQIGIPIITFVFGSYWDDHYRSRSWYHDRDRYSHVTPHYGHADTSGGSHYQSSGSSHTYQAPGQAPAGQPRQSGTTTSQPSYQPKPATTTAPHPATTQQRTPEKPATQARPPAEHKTAPAQDQQHAAQPHQQPQPQTQPEKAQHQQQQQQTQQQPAPHQQQPQQQPQQQKQAPPQAKSPPAQGAGKDKGNQGQGKDQSKDQGGGKDQSKDQGGGKGQDKDGGGGKDL
jgi:uncharacterized protein YraI